MIRPMVSRPEAEISRLRRAVQPVLGACLAMLCALVVLLGASGAVAAQSDSDDDATTTTAAPDDSSGTSTTAEDDSSSSVLGANPSDNTDPVSIAGIIGFVIVIAAAVGVMVGRGRGGSHRATVDDDSGRL